MRASETLRRERRDRATVAGRDAADRGVRSRRRPRARASRFPETFETSWIWSSASVRLPLPRAESRLLDRLAAPRPLGEPRIEAPPIRARRREGERAGRGGEH